MYTTRDKRGHVGVCLTLILKVNCQGYVNYFGLFEIPDLENGDIDAKIRPVACIPSETKKVTQGMADLDFQGQRSEPWILFQFFWYPWPQKC